MDEEWEPTEEEKALAAVAKGPSSEFPEWEKHVAEITQGPGAEPYRASGRPLMSTEIHLEDGWTVKGFFDPEDAASLDIVAMTIMPTSWNDVPPGGLTPETLDTVSVSELREFFLAQLVLYRVFISSGARLPDDPAQQEHFFGQLVKHAPTPEQLRKAVRRLRPTRRSRDKDSRLADVAIRYLEAQERDPAQVLKEMVYQYARDGRKGRDGKSLAYPTVRNWVAEAKREEWLAGEGQGKRGGTRMGPKLDEWLKRRADAAKED